MVGVFTARIALDSEPGNKLCFEPSGHGLLHRITGGQGATYTATIIGSVSPNIDQGGVNIHFTSPTTQNFTFSNASGSGTFSLTVADLFVETGRSANITAGITGSQSPIPEPTTLLLLGTGLTGVATKLRQRSRARKENR